MVAASSRPERAQGAVGRARDLAVCDGGGQRLRILEIGRHEATRPANPRPVGRPAAPWRRAVAASWHTRRRFSPRSTSGATAVAKQERGVPARTAAPSALSSGPAMMWPTMVAPFTAAMMRHCVPSASGAASTAWSATSSCCPGAKRMPPRQSGQAEAGEPATISAIAAASSTHRFIGRSPFCSASAPRTLADRP